MWAVGFRYLKITEVFSPLLLGVLYSWPRYPESNNNCNIFLLSSSSGWRVWFWLIDTQWKSKKEKDLLPKLCKIPGSDKIKSSDIKPVISFFISSIK